MKHYTTSRVVTALLCTTTAALITGCSTDSPEPGANNTVPAAKAKHPFDTMTAEQIDKQAREAVKNTTSMRISGKVSSDGQQVEVDLAFDIRGSCNGAVDNSMGTLHIIKKGSLVYAKAGEDYWRATFSRGMTVEQAEKMVGHFTDRWIKPPALMAKTLGNFCDGFDSVLELLSAEPHGNATRENDATVDGRPTAVLTERTPTDTTTVYIAKESKPYLLRATITGGNDPLDLTFTDHNTPVDTTPPPPDQILDPTTLR